MSVHKILVGVDGSEGSRNAIEWTADLATDLGAEVVAVHVYEPLGHLDEIGPDAALADVRDRVVRQLDEVWCEPFQKRGVGVDGRVVEGIPHKALLKVADDTGVDLIVLGARRMGAIKAAALGSTSYRVVHDALVPVTIIHGNGD